MEKDLVLCCKLQKPYVQVRRKNGEITYGGDQGFFKGGAPGSVEECKSAMGCGVVAFSDLLLYLGTGDQSRETLENRSYVNRINDEVDYCSYYNCIYDFMGGVSARNGISGIRLRLRFNRLARRERWELRSVWGLSAGRLYGRIEEMLKQDIPVILCIPMMLFKRNKKDGLAFYRWADEWKKEAMVSAHYVTVTGIVRESGSSEIFFEISSWGKKYYINWKEYERLIHTHFLGTILGNVLYIRKRK